MKVLWSNYTVIWKVFGCTPNPCLTLRLVLGKMNPRNQRLGVLKKNKTAKDISPLLNYMNYFTFFHVLFQVNFNVKTSLSWPVGIFCQLDRSKRWMGSGKELWISGQEGCLNPSKQSEPGIYTPLCLQEWIHQIDKFPCFHQVLKFGLSEKHTL